MTLLTLWLSRAPWMVLGACQLVWATRDERHPMAAAACWGLAWSLGASVVEVLVAS